MTWWCPFPPEETRGESQLPTESVSNLTLQPHFRQLPVISPHWTPKDNSRLLEEMSNFIPLCHCLGCFMPRNFSKKTCKYSAASLCPLTPACSKRHSSFAVKKKKSLLAGFMQNLFTFLSLLHMKLELLDNRDNAIYIFVSLKTQVSDRYVLSAQWILVE